MKITEVEIVPVKPDAGLIAFASCVVDGAFYLGSIAVFTKLNGGYRLVFPTKKICGRNLPYHHPINRDASEVFEKEIIGRVIQLFDSQPAS